MALYQCHYSELNLTMKNNILIKRIWQIVSHFFIGVCILVAIYFVRCGVSRILNKLRPESFKITCDFEFIIVPMVMYIIAFVFAYLIYIQNYKCKKCKAKNNFCNAYCEKCGENLD